MAKSSAVVLALMLALAAGCGQLTEKGAEPTPIASTPLRSPQPSSTTAPPPTSRPTTTPTSIAAASVLRVGDRGLGVLGLQRRLLSLGYWLGTPDGDFGDATMHAVVALQKVARLDRDGIVGPATHAALARGVRPTARTRAGDALEVDLERQVLLVVTGGAVTAVLDTSTGGGYTYVEQGRRSIAATPVGTFTITRRADGWVHSPLGWLWRPAYFFAGYAVHGYADVPPFPASHGCVRVTMAAINWMWASGRTRPGMSVSVY